MSEDFKDGNGVAFADYRDMLPNRASDFLKAHVVKNKRLLGVLHQEWKCCIVCGSRRSLNLHHIAHGACGRSDERTNLAMLCSHGPDKGCHSDVHGGTVSLGRLLYYRWCAERESVDWVRLAILFRHFLPDLDIL